jgi:putative membrane protein
LHRYLVEKAKEKEKEKEKEKGAMYWFWGMNMFWWIFWLALLAVMFVWVLPRGAHRRDSAIDVLREKYAAGEMADDEYRHRLAVLNGREAPLQTREPPHTGTPAAV